MKKFKAFISEDNKTPPALYVRVTNGRAQLCDANSVGGACATFGNDIVMAQMAGANVVTTTKDGVTQTWRVDMVSRQVVGPFNHR